MAPGDPPRPAHTQGSAWPRLPPYRLAPGILAPGDANNMKLKTSKNGNGSPATFTGMFWDHTP